jgi:hypothetical protein
MHFRVSKRKSGEIFLFYVNIGQLGGILLNAVTCLSVGILWIQRIDTNDTKHWRVPIKIFQFLLSEAELCVMIL